MGLGDVVTRTPHVAQTGDRAVHQRPPRVLHLGASRGLLALTRQPSLSQPAFLEAVIDAARAFPNFRVELGVTVSGL